METDVCTPLSVPFISVLEGLDELFVLRLPQVLAIQAKEALKASVNEGRFDASLSFDEPTRGTLTWQVRGA